MYHRDRYVPPEIGPWVQANAFLRDTYVRNPVPYFYEDRQRLPQPLWQGHDSAIRLYYYAWEVAFGNFIRPNRESRFIADFVETAFNSHLFMWDSAFITIFCQYVHRLFPAIRTLDNFYARQHPDGYICRQLIEADGSDEYAENDPDGTGPNIMTWVEWLHYLRFGDKERLQKIFAPLYAYHLWYRRYRAWPDGTYFATGWSSGLDNSARIPDSEHYHQYWSWLDATAQQALDAKMLANIGDLCGHQAEATELRAEYAQLRALINDKFWDEESGFYYDRPHHDRLGPNKAITSYWALVADLVPEERMARFVSHLEDERSFKRLHRIPTLAANASGYNPGGAYWNGGVWAPTNYMVIKGLVEHGYRQLAHEIALNHVENMVQVYRDTQTIWENYAPDVATRGNLSRPRFVGWSGLGPIAMLFENVMGIESCAIDNTVTWDIRLPEPHGVVNLPFESDCETTLRCSAEIDGKRVIHIQANRHYQLTCTYKQAQYQFDIAPGDQFYELPSGRQLKGKAAEAKTRLPEPQSRGMRDEVLVSLSVGANRCSPCSSGDQLPALAKRNNAYYPMLSLTPPDEAFTTWKPIKIMRISFPRTIAAIAIATLLLATVAGATAQPANPDLKTQNSGRMQSAPTKTQNSPTPARRADPSTPTATLCSFSYTDVPPNYWAYQAIGQLTCLGAISGYPGGSFLPNANMQRDQVAKVMVLAKAWQIQHLSQIFSDVPPTYWAYDYIQTSYAFAAVTGYSDNQTSHSCASHGVASPCFLPHNNITRAELTSVVVRIQGWAPYDPPTPTFSDVPRTNWAYQFIETGYLHGVINGYADGTFRPNSDITRAEVCKVVSLGINNP